MTYALNGISLSAPAHGFFQVNPRQTEVMISTIAAAIGEGRYGTVFDLYCGVGTLGLVLADRFDALYGNEISEASILYARENAKNNSISATFEAGDAATVTQRWTRAGIHPDLIIIDPPRKGCDSEMITLLKTISAPRLVYVSCDPATLARDLKDLSDLYTVEWIQPIDMFGHTAHVESVASLLIR